jgi:hypothetical protein
VRREDLMNRSAKFLGIAGGLIAVIVGVTAGIALVSTGAGADEDEVPITGAALERASAAALAHTGGGRVTDTEVGDEESMYEVEVMLDDGRTVDVQLDESFNVVGGEQERGDEGPGDD